jgi:dihydrofolate reductase
MNESRQMIAAMQVSLDGLIEDADGQVDWVGSWDDSFDLLPQIDTCILGAGMYPGYEQYWMGILANPTGVLPLTGKVPTEEEVAYARFADETPHVVLSTTMEEAAWETTRIVRDVEAISDIKREPGRDIYVVGGATLVSSLMNHGLIDEIRLTVQPIVLGAGKPLFKDVTERHRLELVQARPLAGGKLSLTYRTAASAAPR